MPTSGPYKGDLVAVISLKEYLKTAVISDPHSIEPLGQDWKSQVVAGVNQVNDKLRESLAPYMIPNAWIIVKSIPVNQSGKMNRKRIGEWVGSLSEAEANRLKTYGVDKNGEIVPLTDHQYAIRRAFSHALNIPEAAIGIHSSFFTLGGDSISAMRVARDIRLQTNMLIQMQDVFLYKTVARLTSAA